MNLQFRNGYSDIIEISHSECYMRAKVLSFKEIYMTGFYSSYDHSMFFSLDIAYRILKNFLCFFVITNLNLNRYCLNFYSQSYNPSKLSFVRKSIFLQNLTLMGYNFDYRNSSNIDSNLDSL